MKPTDNGTSARRARLPRWAWLAGFAIGLLWAAESCQAGTDGLDLGLSFMAGGRYDNMRMCVASEAGVKGGPIADVSLTARHSLNQRLGLSFTLPVMRPILFGAAFRMLQFEPYLGLHIRHQTGGRAELVLIPGVGASFHYGPDYRSDRTHRSPSFFAAGPLLNVFAGVGFGGSGGLARHLVGIKPFYTALLSRDHGRGTVVGAALEYGRSL